MENTEQSIVKSLDGSETEIFPYLPYLLQDLWSFGSDPNLILEAIIRNNLHNKKNFSVLDLGCGKGAVSINLAKNLGCMVHGIDAMPSFIEEAKKYAQRFKISHLCNFEVADIRLQVKNLHNYDIVILGSIGPVLGNLEDTIKIVRSCLKQDGYIILDDCYLPDESNFKNENYLKRNEVIHLISKSSVKIIEEYRVDENFISEADEDIYSRIENRANELIVQLPQKAYLFENYLKAQREENYILENEVVCVTWILQNCPY